MKVAELLDAAKAAQGLTSDNQLAKAIGVTRAAVSSWRTGVKTPDPVACATLAGLTGLPLAQVLGIVGEARAVSREEKAVWKKLASTAAGLALIGLCVVAAGNSEGTSTTYAAAFLPVHIMLYAPWPLTWVNTRSGVPLTVLP